ncbi:heterogeneous nuclear ribonucleoprotein K [Clonorchis sinensis]|uniref:Heterogeneous nuclear ribonucleoprotein K n=1 Tax=Clonorchis sinensis TaxID=79923 RepID=G7YU71_CLOSI|nr:heterogeneous nuclear ribonucleoprotein K [Clonorchis sinensis]
MNAKLSDPKRIMGHVPFKRRPRPGAESEEPEKEDEEDDSMLDYRILVHESQAGSVIGRGGERIKELRDKYRMRVIKVYQLLAPMSTDRVVQMVAEPENAIACLKSVVEAVESAPPRGRREDYDAANFCEADALNYGGFLSREALQALSQGMPIQRPMGMPPYMGGGPYQMGGPMGPGPMPGGMGPMGAGMGPMGGGRGPMGGGRGQMGGGRGTRPGGMMGTGGPRSTPGGPAPVPPPGGPRGGPPAPVGSTGGYGGPGAPYGGPGFDGAGGYDGSMYNADTPGQTGYGGQSFGGSGGAPAAGGYGGGSGYGTGAPRGAGDMAPPAGGARGGSYGGYGAAAPGMHDDAKYEFPEQRKTPDSVVPTNESIPNPSGLHRRQLPCTIVGSHHALVCCCFLLCFSVLRKTRTSYLAIQKRVDPEIKQYFQNRLLERLADSPMSDIDDHWGQMPKALLSTGTTVCGTNQPTSSKHWISSRTVASLEVREQILPDRNHNSTYYPNPGGTKFACLPRSFVDLKGRRRGKCEKCWERPQAVSLDWFDWSSEAPCQ